MLRFLVSVVVLIATSSLADVPRVATDTPPVHSLASRVMAGVGTPDLIIDKGTSPHSHALRPSEAAALEDADVVFWVGPELTPWLEKPLKILAGGAALVELIEADGTRRLPFREGAAFPEDAEGHGHDGDDPHAWLDPENGKVWLDTIAGELAARDPENAEAYRANAADGRDEIDAAADRIDALLEPRRGAPFVVFHDAYHYFEDRFGLSAAGAIAAGDAAKPGPARVAAIRDLVRANDVRCVLSEPQVASGLIATVLEGVTARQAIVDPAGGGLASGPGLYIGLLEHLATELAECLS